MTICPASNSSINSKRWLYSKSINRLLPNTLWVDASPLMPTAIQVHTNMNTMRPCNQPRPNLPILSSVYISHNAIHVTECTWRMEYIYWNVYNRMHTMICRWWNTHAWWNPHDGTHTVWNLHERIPAQWNDGIHIMESTYWNLDHGGICSMESPRWNLLNGRICSIKSAWANLPDEIRTMESAQWNPHNGTYRGSQRDVHIEGNPYIGFMILSAILYLVRIACLLVCSYCGKYVQVFPQSTLQPRYWPYLPWGDCMEQSLKHYLIFIYLSILDD